MNLSGRDFLKILDFSEDELRYMLATAKKFKEFKEKFYNLYNMYYFNYRRCFVFYRV